MRLIYLLSPLVGLTLSNLMGFGNFEPRKVVVMIGLSGSGKSFVAKRLEETLGYTVLRSDEIRKRLAGLNPSDSAKSNFGQGIYNPEMTQKVYITLVEKAKELIQKGEKVVLDATFLRKWQRELVLRNFPSAVFVWVYAPEKVVLERLRNRKDDISDADISVYKKQKEIFEPPTEILTTYTIRSENWEKIIPFLGD